MADAEGPGQHLRARVGDIGEPAPQIPLADYGEPRRLFARAGRLPQVGPFRPRTWKSPLRGPWLTSVFAVVLLVGLPIVAVTGLLSYIAYGPQFHQALPAHVGFLHLPYFLWPTHPAWLYRFTQGLHVALGIALVPVVLAKLWSVIPKLFAWPPARSLFQIAERLSLALLVGSILFELATGLLDIQYDYLFRFDFYTAHYYGAWVFIGSFVLHVVLKMPAMLRGIRLRSLRRELRTNLARTEPDPYEPGGLAPEKPATPTLTRRGLFGIVAGSSLLLTIFTLGATLTEGLRFTAIFSSRGQSYGRRPGQFQVNRTAAEAQVTPAIAGTGWRLAVHGPKGVVMLSRAQLLAMPQHTQQLPIACVEGWSALKEWTGVRLVDLAALAGLPAPYTAFITSLEKQGAFRQVTLGGSQVRNPRSLLALKVDGVDLPLDHGFPARIIVPALPGVHNTKWVSTIEFRGAA